MRLACSEVEVKYEYPLNLYRGRGDSADRLPGQHHLAAGSAFTHLLQFSKGVLKMCDAPVQLGV